MCVMIIKNRDMITEIKKKVLIIDDDKFLLDMYVFKFFESGFEAIPALGGIEAISRIKEGVEPDIILLDLVMPTMDGFQFLEKKKEEKLALNAKVIILSNLEQEEGTKQDKISGVVKYIVKATATPSEVVEMVKEITKQNN